jgi:hypothetical protein
MRSSTYGDVTLKKMPLRTCVRLVGILTVRLLGEQKMTDLTDTSLEALLRKMIDEAPKTGAIPTNMIYWSKAQDPNLWANAEKDTWEIKVDFHD